MAAEAKSKSSKSSTRKHKHHHRSQSPAEAKVKHKKHHRHHGKKKKKHRHRSHSPTAEEDQMVADVDATMADRRLADVVESAARHIDSSLTKDVAKLPVKKRDKESARAVKSAKIDARLQTSDESDAKPSDSETKPSAYSTDLQAWPQIPSIAHFCSLFRQAFDLVEFDIQELEESLLLMTAPAATADDLGRTRSAAQKTEAEENQFGGQLVESLVIKLLSGSSRAFYMSSINEDNYNTYLRRLFLAKLEDLDEEKIPRYTTLPEETTQALLVEQLNFRQLHLVHRVIILHQLCQFRLEADDVADKVRNLDADSLRVEPLGIDSSGTRYWYFYGTRLYKETPISRKLVDSLETVAQNTSTALADMSLTVIPTSSASVPAADLPTDDESVSSRRRHHKRKQRKTVHLVTYQWTVACATLDDWERLTEVYRIKSESGVGDEGEADTEMYETLAENFLPDIRKMFAEKEREQRRRLTMMSSKRFSSRLERRRREQEDRDREQAIKREEQRKAEEAYDEKLRMDREEREREARIRRLEARQSAKDDQFSRLQSESSDSSDTTRITGNSSSRERINGLTSLLVANRDDGSKSGRQRRQKHKTKRRRNAASTDSEGDESSDASSDASAVGAAGDRDSSSSSDEDDAFVSLIYGRLHQQPSEKSTARSSGQRRTKQLDKQTTDRVAKSSSKTGMQSKRRPYMTKRRRMEEERARQLEEMCRLTSSSSSVPPTSSASRSSDGAASTTTAQPASTTSLSNHSGGASSILPTSLSSSTSQSVASGRPTQRPAGSLLESAGISLWQKYKSAKNVGAESTRGGDGEGTSSHATLSTASASSATMSSTTPLPSAASGSSTSSHLSNFDQLVANTETPRTTGLSFGLYAGRLEIGGGGSGHVNSGTLSSGGGGPKNGTPSSVGVSTRDGSMQPPSQRTSVHPFGPQVKHQAVVQQQKLFSNWGSDYFRQSLDYRANTNKILEKMNLMSGSSTAATADAHE